MTSATIAAPATPRDFLLVPSMPTPNGRLHLGHIAGPFLRLDMMARFLRSRGHRARLLSGTDPYEAHVPLQAEREGRTPREVASDYTAGIRRDLAAMRIECEIVDPLTAPGQEPYERHTRLVMRRLEEAGVAEVRPRRFARDADTDAFLPRSYLAGHCPRCEAEVAGCVCEACGHQFFAHEVLRPRLRAVAANRAGGRTLAWSEVPTLAVRLPQDDPRLRQIVAAIDRVQLPARYRDVAVRHVEQTGMAMELAVPGRWGVPWPSSGAVPQIVFNYATPYAWTHVLGELAGSWTPAGLVPAFTEASDIVTIGSFGVDITACWVAGTIGLCALDTQACPRPRPFDYYWGNEFLDLHGEKFSTSRRHVIWAGELVDRTPVTADMARYYLATIDPAQRATDFRIDRLVATVNDVILGRIHRATRAALRRLGDARPEPPSEPRARALRQLFDAQAECFALTGARLDAAAEQVGSWVDRHRRWSDRSPGDDYWFLKGLALVSAPLMPEFAQRLWTRLGASGSPCLRGFEVPTAPRPSSWEPALAPLNIRDLEPCLPSTLRAVEGPSWEAPSARAHTPRRIEHA